MKRKLTLYAEGLLLPFYKIQYLIIFNVILISLTPLDYLIDEYSGWLSFYL